MIISSWKDRGTAKHSVGLRELSCIEVIVQPPPSHEFPVAAYRHYYALVELMHGRTSIIVAHRLSTIRDADQILLLDQGRVVEIGSHRELMARRGMYYNLYTSQFSDAS